jgi:hypothetical protein
MARFSPAKVAPFAGVPETVARSGLPQMAFAISAK